MGDDNLDKDSLSHAELILLQILLAHYNGKCISTVRRIGIQNSGVKGLSENYSEDPNRAITLTTGSRLEYGQGKNASLLTEQLTLSIV